MFTRFLHISHRPPFFIYMFFTCFIKAPFFHLHDFYMFHKSPFFHLHGFYMFHKGPLFHLHGFYRVSNIAFPEFLLHSVALFTSLFSDGLLKPFTCFFTTEDTVKVGKIFYRFLHVLQIIIVEKDYIM